VKVEAFKTRQIRIIQKERKMNTKIGKRIFSTLTATLLVLVLILILGTVQPVHAQEVTCTVTSNADSSDGSLRAFLAEPTCDTITFAGDTTIHLASTLTLSQDVTIDGGTNNVVISGDSNGDGTGETYLFDVPSGFTASFQRLTFEKGAIGKPDKTGNYRMGGAIWNAGALTVANSTFTGNSATNFGGAIYNQGSLNVTGSLFSGNSVSQVGSGGAIYNYSNSTMAVANTTFTGNTASSGGAILNYSGTLTITNSTISGNSASSYAGKGGINNVGTYTVKNSIFANNSGGNCSPSWTGDSTGNLYDDYSCTPPGSTYSTSPLLGPLGNYGGNTQTIPLLPGSPAIDAGDNAACPATDQRGVSRPQGAGCDTGAFESWGFSLTATSGANQLAALGTAFANPLVATVSSASGEPVDGGKVIFIGPQDGPGAIYQGGMGTITGGQVYAMLNANDIQGGYTVTAKIRGAAGIPGADFFLVNGCLPDPVVTSAADSGPSSLRQAIAWACPGGTITFAGDTTIHLASQLTLSQDVTIDGGTNNVVLSGDSNNDGTGDVQIFYVNSGVNAALQNLTMTKGSAARGGAILNYGTLTANNCNFSDNRATDLILGGGGINNNGTATVTNSTFSGNSAIREGGGIATNYGTSVSITNSTFSGNSTSTNGGGIYNYSGTLTVMNSTFTGNSAHGEGGAIAGTVTVTGSTFANNSATDGGGISVGGTVTNSTFSGNSASNNGGGIFAYDGLTVKNSTLSGNRASSGGGIYIARGSSIFDNSLIANSNGGNCNENVNFQSSANLADDASCGFTNSSTIRLGTLGDYGGATQTIPLLPGSYAINRGNTYTCPATDQRGVARVGACDIGAFESQGFSLAVSGGDNQTALPGAAYASPLEVTVSSAYAEPVDGGAVSFLAPTTGASATITGSPATITGGKASVTATANSTSGAYSVRANATGATYNSTSFSLTNTQPTIDTTPPSITPNIVGTLGQNGWYTSDVTLSWTVIDNESAVTSQTGCDPAMIIHDQAETSYTCSATSAGGTSSITATIKRDATSPVVAVTGVTGGSTYILGAVPAAGCSTTDAISDVGTNATLNLTGGNTLGVGSFSATCSGAKDNAGNAAGPVSVHYNVTFQFTGFSSPVDNPGVVNVAKAGQTIPLRWRITDANGNPITVLTSVTVTAASLSCSAGTTTDQIEEYATGNSGLQNLGDGYYQWNWKTPTSYANSCKTMKLDLGEGLFHTALFQFKK
jgi:predicted outer membrane repeat protein